MSDTNSPRPASSTEMPPSSLCTDCPGETCLEFRVVNYWGEPVKSPTKFELDGKPVSPDTPIRPLKPGKHILKAVDGEALRQEITARPYEPVGDKPTPSMEKAEKEKLFYVRVPKTQLWDGLPLIEKVQSTSTSQKQCQKFLIEMDGGIDYCILMVFLDNHSGGLHGTGHAGVLIINGETRQGLYTDFGPYYEKSIVETTQNIFGRKKTIEKKLELGQIRIDTISINMLYGKNGKLNEKLLANIFHNINRERGSTMISIKPCRFKKILNGPDHGNIPGEVTRKYAIHHAINTSYFPIKPDSFFIAPGFSINGLIAWAAYMLPGGAYQKMEKYAHNEKTEMEKQQSENKNGYDSVSFNCMTYSLAVLDKGRGLDRSPGIPRDVDHPNAHIQEYMDVAQDRGIFDNRLFYGEFEAVTGKNQSRALGIRHRKVLNWVFSLKKLYVRP